MRWIVMCSEHSSFSEIQTFLSEINYRSMSFIVPEQGAGDLMKELSEQKQQISVISLNRNKRNRESHVCCHLPLFLQSSLKYLFRYGSDAYRQYLYKQDTYQNTFDFGQFFFSFKELYLTILN